MTAPVFDSAAFGGDPEVPPVPMVICWDDLNPAGYATVLDALTGWLGWFRSTYRVPATVFPPCWYAHPGIREDLGHLWTGWLVTRHPDAGVGMIGLDWDSRREQAISRLREGTAVTGCTASQHRDEQPMPSDPDTHHRTEHIAQEQQTRSREALQHSAIQAVTDRLQRAELRHDLAAQVLADVTDNPGTATDEETVAVAAELHRLASEAPRESAVAARDAVRSVTDIQDTAARESTLAAARLALATAIVTGTLDGTGTGTADEPAATDATQRWLAALEELLPAELAATRAAAIAATRSAAIERRLTARNRHPDVERLVSGGDVETPDGEGDPE